MVNKNYFADEKSLEYLKIVKEKFGEKVKIENNVLIVEKDILIEVCKFLKEIGFDKLSTLLAIDYINENLNCVVYELYSYENNVGITIKVFVDRNSPILPSVTSIWLNADWNEREAFDLMGIKFENHPNLKRLLLKDDWVGHPLRKDDNSGDPPYEIDWNEIENQKYILNMKSINEKLEKWKKEQ